MPKPPQDIYARHLMSRRGYPLWTPEPSHQLLAYRREGLRIGDVGVVIPEDGCFDVFFNICLPHDHPFHRATGVPDNFTPIKLDDMEIRTIDNAETPGRVLANSSVKSVRTIERPADSSSRILPFELEYHFELPSSEGALLILPEGAERRDLRNYHRFLEMATQHATDWYQFAEERVGHLIGNDSLYLVTGFYKTTSWSLAAFEKTAGTAEYPARFKVSQSRGDNVAPTCTWDTRRALEWRVGPISNDGIANQAVFIRGFKIALRAGMFGTRWISVKADAPSTRPNTTKSFGVVPGSSFLGYVFGGRSAHRIAQSSGSGPQDEVITDPALGTALDEIQNKDALAVGENVIIQRVPEASQAFHPSDIINQYLLNKELAANVAITHDDDWITMLEENLLQPEHLAQEGRLETLLSEKYDIIVEEGVVYPRSRGESGSSNPDEVDVAMEGDSEDLDTMIADPVLPTMQEEVGAEESGGQAFTTLLSMQQMSSEALPSAGSSATNRGYQCMWFIEGIRCEQMSPDFDELITHLRRAHGLSGISARQKVTCRWSADKGFCGMQYRRDAFRRHIATHLSLKYSCTDCGKTFSRKDSLRVHTRKAHGQG